MRLMASVMAGVEVESASPRVDVAWEVCSVASRSAAAVWSAESSVWLESAVSAVRSSRVSRSSALCSLSASRPPTGAAAAVAACSSCAIRASPSSSSWVAPDTAPSTWPSAERRVSVAAAAEESAEATPVDNALEACASASEEEAVNVLNVPLRSVVSCCTCLRAVCASSMVVPTASRVLWA